MESKTVEYPMKEVEEIKAEAAGVIMMTDEYPHVEAIEYGRPVLKFIIKTHDDAVTLAEHSKKLRVLQKAIDEKLRPGIKKADELHSWLLDLLKQAVSPLKAREKLIDDAITNWTREQKRIADQQAAEAQRKAQEEARQKEEAERKRLEEQKITTAAKLEESGFVEEANAMMERPIEVNIAPEVPKPIAAPVKIQGFSTAKLYYADIVNPFDLICEIASRHPEWIALLFRKSEKRPGTWELDDSGLSGMAKSLKDELRIPGVQVRVEESSRKTTK